MNDTQEELIAELALAYHNAMLDYNMRAARNVYGITADEQRQSTIDFHLAHARVLETRAMLEKAKFALAMEIARDVRPRHP